MQIIENWAVIFGRVVDLAPEPELDGFTAVRIWVERVEPVEGFPNLVTVYLAEVDEPRLSVLAPTERVLQLHLDVGARLECRVRRAGLERIYADRDTLVVLQND